jgi:hypothetical protein
MNISSTTVVQSIGFTGSCELDGVGNGGPFENAQFYNSNSGRTAFDWAEYSFSPQVVTSVQFISNGCYVHSHGGHITFTVEIRDSNSGNWHTVHQRHGVSSDWRLDFSFTINQAVRADRIKISDGGAYVSVAHHGCGSEQIRIFGSTGKASLEYQAPGGAWTLLKKITSPGRLDNLGAMTLPSPTQIEKLRITTEDGATVRNCGPSGSMLNIRGFKSSAVSTFHGCDTGVEASFNRQDLPDIQKTLSARNDFDKFEVELEHVGTVRSMQFLGSCNFQGPGHFQVSVMGPNAWHVVLTKHHPEHHSLGLDQLGVIDMTAFNRPVHAVKIEAFSKSPGNDQKFKGCSGLSIRFNPQPSKLDLAVRQDALAPAWTMPTDFESSFTQTTSILSGAIEATKLRFDSGMCVATSSATVELSTYSRSTGQWQSVATAQAHAGSSFDHIFGHVNFGLRTVFGLRVQPDADSVVALHKQDQDLFQNCAGLSVHFN